MALKKTVACENDECGFYKSRVARGQDRRMFMADLYLEGRSYAMVKCPNCRKRHEYRAAPEDHGITLKMGDEALWGFLNGLARYAFQEPEIVAGVEKLREALLFWAPPKKQIFKKSVDIDAKTLLDRFGNVRV